MLITPYIESLSESFKKRKIKQPDKKTMDWERKKCKSCSAYQSSENYGMCAFPNNKACKYYEKLKK
jgi:hypothetical protein